jgi:hypothetical protein
MAKVIIGNVEYQIDEFNFIALERSWPYIQEALTNLDPIRGASAGICVVAAGIVESKTFKLETFDIKPEELLSTINKDDQVFDRVVSFLKKNLLAANLSSITAAVNDITKEAGLVAEPGEDEAGDQLSLSMETSTQS